MNRYPTEEELARLIESLEQEELYAPGHLKEEILLKAESLEEKAKPVSFLSYTIKMVAGMAAAIILTFAVPFSNGSDLSYAASPAERLMEEKYSLAMEQEKMLEEREKRSDLDEKITGYMERKRKDMNEEADSLVQKISSLFSRENGGIDNEN